MIDYPQKGSHYAHKTFRLMHKAMVAAEYGRDVMCLLAVILHTEDAARYRGPVSFFNTQLMETLGFKKWDQFDAVRAKAIASGWLQYEGCGKRTPGRYFVTIPEGFGQVDDGLMEECIPPKNGYNDGYKDGYKHGYDEGVNVGITRGQTRVTSYPTPNPAPNPAPQNNSSEPLQASEPVDPTLVFELVGKDSGPWSPPLSLIEQLEAWYPSLDVRAELRKAAAWHQTNKANRKTLVGVEKFLNLWLSRATDSGRGIAKPKQQWKPGERDPLILECEEYLRKQSEGVV